MSLLLEGIYPRRCFGCATPYTWLCASCEEGCVWLAKPCSVVRSDVDPILKEVYAMARYAQPLWQAMVRGVKFEQVHELSPVLERLAFAWKLQMRSWPWGEGEGWTILPIPTNPEHILERGRDHQLVWTRVAQMLLPRATLAKEVVRRRASHLAHAKLRLEASRAQAAAGSFALEGVVPERVILVDDVYTSGATMQTLGGLLRERGCEQVGGLVAAWAGA